MRVSKKSSRRNPGGPVVVSVGGVQRRDAGRRRQQLRGPDRLPSQVTGQCPHGQLRQGARPQPPIGHLGSLDQLQRDRRGDREHRVQAVSRLVHAISLAGARAGETGQGHSGFALASSPSTGSPGGVMR